MPKRLASGWAGELTSADRLLATPFAVVMGLTYNFLPFMTLPIYASLERVDPRLVEASGDLYAKPFTGFRKVTWPLSLPGVVGRHAAHVHPRGRRLRQRRAAGRPSNTMIGNRIEYTFLSVNDYPTAACSSFILMITILVLVLRLCPPRRNGGPGMSHHDAPPQRRHSADGPRGPRLVRAHIVKLALLRSSTCCCRWSYTFVFSFNDAGRHEHRGQGFTDNWMNPCGRPRSASRWSTRSSGCS